MALKAGTVGLNPKFVDNNGAPITVDAYSKAQVDEKLAAKANISYLTANNKKFQFAYDSESGKYGYKAGAQDDFHPFEAAGSGVGWVKPADLITTGMDVGVGLEYLSGGYYHDTDNKICYLDVALKKTASGSSNLVITPKASAVDMYILAAASTEGDTSDDYTANWYWSITPVTTGSSISIGSATGTYLHLFGMYNTV